MISGYAQVEGGRLYYEADGGGHPLVLIHAGFLDSRMWDAQFAIFSEKFRVIRYDVRGFGRSDRPRQNYSDRKDLFDLLKHLDIKSASLIGVSNGGRIALDFTVDYPEMVNALVLIGTGVSGYEVSGPDEEKIWEPLDKAEKLQEEAMKANRVSEAVKIDIDLWASAQRPASRERIFAIAMDNSSTQADTPGRLQVRPSPPVFKRLSEIQTPTLLIVGDRDVKGMQLISQRLHMLIPNSKLIVLQGADHIANMSRPEEFDRAVMEFLENRAGLT